MNPYSDIDFWYQNHLIDCERGGFCAEDCDGTRYCQLMSCMLHYETFSILDLWWSSDPENPHRTP